MNMKKVLFISALIAGVFVLVGCAAEPTEKITAANDAYQRASAPEVAEYAPDSVNAATEVKSKLDAELHAQNDKLGIFRKYDQTAELAAQLKSTSESAVTSANTAKEKARTEASAAIADARRAVEEARSLLAEAPAGKGTQADVVLLKSDLDGVDSSLKGADDDLQAGRYKEARSKADTARQSAEDVKNQVLAAKKARTGARPSRA